MLSELKEQILNNGFAVINDIFSDREINGLLAAISKVDISNQTVRKHIDLFAIRQFLKEIPEAASIIFNDKLKTLIEKLFGDNFFVVKSIYFDKPGTLNWFVAYHQDLTISVDKKFDIKGFGPWTIKQDQYAVQPPIDILQDNFTVRIHLDDTNQRNGALKVVPKSHQKGIYRPETIDWTKEEENICCVNKGGVMFMKPLLLHSSGRTTDNNKRRVIHIEFSRSSLPDNLNWSEFMSIPAGSPGI